MDVISNYIGKTSFIKSFPPIRYYLEKGLNEKHGIFLKKSKFSELIDSFGSDLSININSNELSKLKELEIKVPKNGILLFPDYLNYGLVGFNLEKCESLFRQPGWLFHATTDIGLKAVSKSGLLRSPVEMILSEKRYASGKFESSIGAERIGFGISFAFQDAKKYQTYTNRVERGSISGQGGFFIFPLNEAITDGTILQSGGVDGYPEICLLDPKQRELADLFNLLIYLLKEYNHLLKKFDYAKKFFDICKKNIDKIREISRGYKEDIMDHHFEIYKTIFLLKKDTRILNAMEDSDLAESLMKEKLGNERVSEFFIRLKKYAKNGYKSKEYIRYYNIYRKYQRQAVINHYAQNSILWGDDEFFHGIDKMGLNEFQINLLLKSLEENDFFTFLLNVNRLYFGSGYIVPKYSVYESKKDPTYLISTIFHGGFNAYIDGYHNFGYYVGKLLVSQLQKIKKEISPRIFEEAKKLSPKEVRNLIGITKSSVIESINLIVPRSRTKNPSVVDVRKSVLFLTKRWYDSEINKKIMEKIISIGAPVIVGFESYGNNLIEESSVNSVVHNLLGAKNLPLGRECWSNRGYFFSKNVKGVKEMHYKDKNSEIRIS